MTSRKSTSSSISSVSSVLKSVSNIGGDGIKTALGLGSNDGPIDTSKNIRSGLSWGMTAFFLIAQMAGAGFLSLPNALANTGWLGTAMMTIFCAMVGLSGTRLGICWVILEERWPEHYGSAVRQPYMEIAYRALGNHGRRLAMASVLITLVGGTTVFIILVAQMINPLIDDLSVCEWVLVIGFVLMPLTWLGTPKDFWQASVAAVVATVVACLVVFIELFINPTGDAYVQYTNPTVSSFSLGFGAILFAFGGASTFPTIQNDMKDRTQFWKSVVVAFIGILSLYLPVAAAGYGLLGSEVSSNIILAVEFNTVVKCAIVMEIVNLIGTYIISFNPIGQGFEEMFNVPGHFGWQRIVLRSSIVAIEMVICLAVPDFGLILNLIGGSTVTLCSFVLPPIMYMKLVDNCDNPNWPKRVIPLWERVALWEIVIVGSVGGIASTVSAFIAIIDPDSFSQSCFTNFS